MKNIFSFLSKESKNIDGSKNPKTHLKHKSSEYTKIANFHYHSKFTSMNDKIHEKVSIKSPTSLFPSNNNRKTDLEEIETFKNKDSEEFIKIELTKLDIIILSFVCFCIEFGYSLEIVFITPHFMILDLPPFLDTLIWLFPPLLILIIYPSLQILIESTKFLSFFQKKILMAFLISISGIGLYLLSTSEALAIKLSPFHNYSQINYYSIVFSILGFLLVDIANELINSIINFHVSCLNPDFQALAENYICYGGSIGKISGFFVSSFLALDIYTYTIKRYMNFVNFAFTVGLIIQIVCFFLFLILFPNKRHLSKSINFSFESFMNELKKLSLNSFLPGITLLKKSPNQMKLILMMHFFASCNILMITVYASSWVGVSILKIDPEYTIFSKRRKIFDVGISWGSVALLFSALTGFGTEVFINKLQRIFSNKWLFIITQAISSITLLILYNTDAFYSVFLILPLCGIAFGTFNTIPELMAEELEEKIIGGEYSKGVYKQMLKTTLFFAELTMFCGVPCFFLLIPEVNEILASLSIAAVLGLISVILCCFC